jgi:hypothetical protein
MHLMCFPPFHNSCCHFSLNLNYKHGKNYEMEEVRNKVANMYYLHSLKQGV